MRHGHWLSKLVGCLQPRLLNVSEHPTETRFFYRNTETDRNRIFLTETEITETETKPNFFKH